MTRPDPDLDAAIDRILALGDTLTVAAPLGLGKPHRVLNALYRRVVADPKRRLHIATALSLTPPAPGSGLRRRFLGPFLSRHFGDDYEALDYALAQRRNALPANVEVEEFYMQSGGLLGSGQAQRDYVSLNYTHVARAVAERGPDLLVQMVAASPDGTRLSFSSNPDLTKDLLDAVAAAGGRRPLLLAEIHPDLPFMDGHAAVPRGFFDIVLAAPDPAPRLFAVPREPVGAIEHAIGLYASTLVPDGGTLQIGIGALSDALAHALILRHRDNQAYRRVLRAIWPGVEDSPLVRGHGGLEPFHEGLYGASEMIMDGFFRLIEAGVVRRRVVDDEALMQRLADGAATGADHERLEREGQHVHGAFFLGSADFYRWLRELPAAERARIGMTRVSQINELYGGHERLERLQRRDARCFNTCMMMTALGAAVSDALEDGRVVSGVGGQYNFVAMSFALERARSVLMFRAVHGFGDAASSNVRWNYGHATIPRHLRDIGISEFGIADLRGRSDRDCIVAMAGIAEARFQQAVLDEARRAGKLEAGFVAPGAWRGNTHARLRELLAPFRADGTLPEYPMGSDFTPVEQRLARALGWLQRATVGRGGKLATIARAIAHGVGTDREALERMGLAEPRGIGEKLEARLLGLALARSAFPRAG